MDVIHRAFYHERGTVYCVSLGERREL